jgi:hypothetical protein
MWPLKDITIDTKRHHTRLSSIMKFLQSLLGHGSIRCPLQSQVSARERVFDP